MDFISSWMPCISSSKGNSDDSAPGSGSQSTWINRMGNTAPLHLPRAGRCAHNEKGGSLGRREAQTRREELGVICSHGQKRFAEDKSVFVQSTLLHLSFLINYYCSIVALQCCVGFCCTEKSISFRYKYTPRFGVSLLLRSSQRVQQCSLSHTISSH